MIIAKNTVVTVHYTLFDAQNNLLEENGEPIVYLHGGYESTLPSIEQALEGKKVGDSVTIQVEPEDAFGEYDADLVKIEARDRFPTPLEVGMQFEGVPEGEDDDEEAMIYVVTDIVDDKVILDGNHPLAGMALRFALRVSEVRGATKEEIDDEYPHFEDDQDGEGGEYRVIPIQ
ncbi:MAG: peptidylprolyl isomerase [Oxalobacter sp.]|nr:MAG: peptidylprolyl isomerase [Oxalobacter sp.]